MTLKLNSFMLRFEPNKKRIKSKSDTNLTSNKKSIISSMPKQSKSHSDLQDLKTKNGTYLVKSRRNNYFNMFMKPKSEYETQVKRIHLQSPKTV